MSHEIDHEMRMIAVREQMEKREIRNFMFLIGVLIGIWFSVVVLASFILL